MFLFCVGGDGISGVGRLMPTGVSLGRGGGGLDF